MSVRPKSQVAAHRVIGRDMAARLRDQQRKADYLRGAGVLTGTFDVKELRALKWLAYELFRERSCLFFDRKEPGIAQLGYYLDPPPPPGAWAARRRYIVMFRGASHREITDQVQVWRSHQTGTS